MDFDHPFLISTAHSTTSHSPSNLTSIHQFGIPTTHSLSKTTVWPPRLNVPLPPTPHDCPVYDRSVVWPLQISPRYDPFLPPTSLWLPSNWRCMTITLSIWTPSYHSCNTLPPYGLLSTPSTTVRIQLCDIEKFAPIRLNRCHISRTEHYKAFVTIIS